MDDYSNFHKVFCDTIPVIQKAAPSISTLLGEPVTGIIIGLFASLVGADACKPDDIAKAMKDDPDLYAKLAKIESTHAEWLKEVNH